MIGDLYRLRCTDCHGGFMEPRGRSRICEQCWGGLAYDATAKQIIAKMKAKMVAEAARTQGKGMDALLRDILDPERMARLAMRERILERMAHA